MIARMRDDSSLATTPLVLSLERDALALGEGDAPAALISQRQPLSIRSLQVRKWRLGPRWRSWTAGAGAGAGAAATRGRLFRYLFWW